MESVRRGFEPKDVVEFGEQAKPTLQKAAKEISFLLNRGYDTKPVTTFVGNHYLLSERQRVALSRILSPQKMVAHRIKKQLAQAPRELWIDGFNLIVTLEVALSGSLLLEGMDGTIRDLAGLRGSYRIVDKTLKAAVLLMQHLDRLGVEQVHIYLDKPVSNSGRLKALLEETAQPYHIQIEITLLNDVDRALCPLHGIATSDAIILNQCGSWFNLGRVIIESSIPEAWILQLCPQ